MFTPYLMLKRKEIGRVSPYRPTEQFNVQILEAVLCTDVVLGFVNEVQIPVSTMCLYFAVT